MTFATLGTFLKYPWTSEYAQNHTDTKGKFNAFPTETDILHKVAEHLGLRNIGSDAFCRHPLAYLVEAADDICNRIMDLEDGVESRLISEVEFRDEIFGPLVSSENADWKTAPIGWIRAKAIGRAVDAVVNTFLEPSRYEKIMSGDYSATDGILLDCVDETVRDIAATATKRVRRLYDERRKVELEIGSFSVLETLLNACLDAFFDWAIHRGKAGKDEEARKKTSLRSQYIFKIRADASPVVTEKDDENFRRCIDFVACMTDDHATFLANQIRGAGR